MGKKQNKLLSLIMVAIATGLSCSASADDSYSYTYGNYYAKAGNNLAWYGKTESLAILSDHMKRDDAGYSFSASLGYKPKTQNEYLKNARFETEMSYYGTDVYGTTAIFGRDVERFGIMANAIYDFVTDSTFKPYIGAGIGAAQARLGSNRQFGIESSTSSVEPAYQLMTGFSYKPKYAEYTEIHLGYKYFSVMDENNADSVDQNATNHSMENHTFESNIKIIF